MFPEPNFYIHYQVFIILVISLYTQDYLDKLYKSVQYCIPLQQHLPTISQKSLYLMSFILPRPPPFVSHPSFSVKQWKHSLLRSYTLPRLAMRKACTYHNSLIFYNGQHKSMYQLYKTDRLSMILFPSVTCAVFRNEWRYFIHHM